MGADPVTIDDATVCRWLSWSFARELDDNTLQVYIDGHATPLFNYLARHQSLVAPLQRLHRAISALSELDHPKLELAADYATLFLGSGNVGAPPYASCYTPPGSLFGAPHERMLRRLKLTDLVTTTLSGEPADHLAVMLDYLSHCFSARKFSRAESSPFEEPTEFIRIELLTWLPSFQKKAEQVQTESDTHKALIALTIEVLVAFSRAPSDSENRDV